MSVQDGQNQERGKAGGSNAFISSSQEKDLPVWLQRLISIVAGLAFMVGMLVVAQTNPYPSDFQYLVYRFVLSFAGAAAVTMLPGGVFEIQFKPWLKATGYLAFFVFIYWYNPIQLASKTFKVDAAVRFDETSREPPSGYVRTNFTELVPFKDGKAELYIPANKLPKDSKVVVSATSEDKLWSGSSDPVILRSENLDVQIEPIVLHKAVAKNMRIQFVDHAQNPLNGLQVKLDGQHSTSVGEDGLVLPEATIGKSVGGWVSKGDDKRKFSVEMQARTDTLKVDYSLLEKVNSNH